MQAMDELTASDMLVPYRDDPMADLESWSPKRAATIAAGLGIRLTDEHWELIFALREHYRAFGPVRARELTTFLEDIAPHGGGRRALYELFPGGPVLQGFLIAGLPKPPGVADLSFGSVQ